MLAGVCGGLARYFQISPVFYRVGFVVLTLLGGAGVLIYAAAALVIPEEGKPDSIAAEILRSRRERPWPLIGLGLVAVAGAVLLSRATLWPRGDAAWVLILVAGAVILWTQRRSKQPELAAASQTTGAVPARDRRRLGRPMAIAALAILLTTLVLAAVTATVFHVDVRNGIGERIYVPAAAADVHRHYRLGIGDLRLDLSGVEFPAGDTEVDLRVGIGRLVVTVPQDVTLRVEASAQAGATRVLGRHDDGRNAGVKVTGTGRRLLVLNAKVGLGDVQVKRSVR